MGEYDVLQRTGDEYFDGNALLAQWNEVNGNKRRRMSEFLDSPKTKEFIMALNEDESHRRKTDNADYQPIIKVKGKNTKNGKVADKVWMSPLLFIKFAMWINPSFEVKVLRFVYDELIKNRHLAGDNYNKLTAQVVKFTDVDYPHLAKGLNYIVFGKHYKGIRDSATTEQLTALHLLEEKLAFAIQMGYITNFDNLISEMQRIYIDNMKKPF